MSECKKCRSLFLEYFYGKLDPPKKKFFDDHILVCEKCKSQFEEMEAVLQFTDKRVRPEPSEEFWDSYEKKLVRRIEIENEKLGRRFSIAP